MRALVASAFLALALAVPLPVAAQTRDMDDGLAFLTFIQSLSAQTGARICERGIRGYRQQFDDLYTRWSARHREGIARGEAIFRGVLGRKDRPDADRALVERVERAINELAHSPRDMSPITPDRQMLIDCEETLSDLEAGLTYPPLGGRQPNK